MRKAAADPEECIRVKILHVAPSVARAYGGPTFSLAGYASAARSAGAEITIAAPRPPYADIEWLSGQLPRAQLELFSWTGKNAFLFSSDLHSWLRRNGSAFDVIHVHGLLNPISSLSSRECVKNGWPVVVRPFGTLSAYTIAHRRSALKRLYFALLERRTLRRVSAVHFTTAVERDESLGHGIAWGSRAFVIPPPVGDRRILPPRIARTSSNVLVIARLNPVKHLELLLDAWPQVLECFPAARLVIAGDGEGQYVRALKQRASACRFVHFAGAVDDILKQRLLEESDLFVLPSFHENFGIAVLEAIAAGLPVVITPEVQLAAFVLKNGLGLVARGSINDFAAAIVSALGDAEMRARCRRDGARIVSESFSPPHIGSELLEMYRFAIAHPLS